MSDFTEAELHYLEERRLGRLVTVGPDGTPHVVPVGMGNYNVELETIDVRGRENERSKKFRDVAKHGRAAIVIDDLASTTPWRPRGIAIRRTAEAMGGPDSVIRIHPERIVSWGIEPDVAGGRTVAGR